MQGMITKRQILLKYGFNDKTFRKMMSEGVVSPDYIQQGKRKTLFFKEGSLRFVENLHYVICLECGKWMSQITTKHLKSCSGMVLQDYKEKYPKVLLICYRTNGNHVKTEEQKQRQSDVLKARFQTEEGQKTREVICQASIRLMKGPYRKQAAKHLKDLNQTTKMKEFHRGHTKKRWEDGGDLRYLIPKWHLDNKDYSNQLAANARRFIKKISKPHIRLKVLLEAAGIPTVTEYEVGYYAIDEAIPGKKISIEMHGCYWHSCPVCGLEGPSLNKRIDKSKATYLKNRGWELVVIWEHELKNNPEMCIDRVKEVVIGC